MMSVASLLRRLSGLSTGQEELDIEAHYGCVTHTVKQFELSTRLEKLYINAIHLSFTTALKIYISYFYIHT